MLKQLAALGAAGAAGAGATGIIHAHAGQRIIVNSRLGCFVSAGSLACGGGAQPVHWTLAHPGLSVDLQSDGRIEIIASPDRRAAIPVLAIRRATCTPGAAGPRCRLVKSVP
ncbi:MAG: hypothetical protein ACREF0_19750 [Acetobacteraceae bacterium]